MGAVGILNINKPPGRTSFSVVSLVKKLTQTKRVGHAGTLDPLATGILPVCLNQATRVIEFLLEQPKTYLAQIELGTVTDTYDAAGKVLQKNGPPSITLMQVEKALLAFQGVIEQRPPMYSAIRYHGQHLYKLARAGLEVERQPRKVEVYSIKLIQLTSPLLVIEVVCGKGTYLRSIAHDLGEALNCGAYLKCLARIKYGPFTINKALPLALLEESLRQGQWQELLHPMDVVLEHWPSFTVSKEAAAALKSGLPLPLTPPEQAENKDTSPYFARAYTEQGHFLAVLLFEEKRQEWRPRKVFPPPD